MDMGAKIAEGFGPLDPQALEATVRVLGMVQLTVPTPTREDSLDRLLLDVSSTFQWVASEVLTLHEEPIGVSADTSAGLHARAVADLLTVLNLRACDEARSFDEEYTRALSMRWLKAIVDVCSSSEELLAWQAKPTDYVRFKASFLADVPERVRAEPQLLLDPEDPRIRTRQMPEDDTDAEIGIRLVRCAASALWMAAVLGSTSQFPTGDEDAEHEQIEWPPTEAAVLEILDDLSNPESGENVSPFHLAVLELFTDSDRGLNARELTQRLSAEYDRPPTRAAIIEAHANHERRCATNEPSDD
jgi:hypothetical protein